MSDKISTFFCEAHMRLSSVYYTLQTMLEQPDDDSIKELETDIKIFDDTIEDLKKQMFRILKETFESNPVVSEIPTGGEESGTIE